MLAKRNPDRAPTRAPTMSESLAASVRALPDDFVTPTSTASPALLLQARLERAVLGSFQHASVEKPASTDAAVILIVAAAAAGWSAVIGGALFLLA